MNFLAGPEHHQHKLTRKLESFGYLWRNRETTQSLMWKSKAAESVWPKTFTVEDVCNRQPAMHCTAPVSPMKQNQTTKKSSYVAEGGQYQWTLINPVLGPG